MDTPSPASGAARGTGVRRARNGNGTKMAPRRPCRLPVDLIGLPHAAATHILCLVGRLAQTDELPLGGQRIFDTR